MYRLRRFAGHGAWVLIGIIGVAGLGGGYYVHANRNPLRPLARDSWAEQYNQLAEIVKGVMKEQTERSKMLLGPLSQDDFPVDLEIEPFNPSIRSTKDRVIVSLQVPKVKNHSIKVDVSKGEIRLAYTVDVVNEKRKGKEVYEKNESEELFQQVLPIPPEAVANTAKVTQDGDTVQITFVRDPKALS